MLFLKVKECVEKVEVSVVFMSVVSKLVFVGIISIDGIKKEVVLVKKLVLKLFKFGGKVVDLVKFLSVSFGVSIV